MTNLFMRSLYVGPISLRNIFIRKAYFKEIYLWEIREVARYPSDVVAIQFSEENTTWPRRLMRQLPF